MTRLGKKGIGRRQFNNPPRIHDSHPVGDLCHETQIVGHEQDAHADLPLQACQEIENLRLNSDVQCRRRLIGDEKGGTAGDRHCDHRALLLSARDLMGIISGAALRLRNADQVKQLYRSHLCNATALAGADLIGLGNLPPEGADRVQTGHRILEDYAHTA